MVMDARRWLNLFGKGRSNPMGMDNSLCSVLKAKYLSFLLCLPYLVYTWSVTHDTTPTTMAEWWLQTPCYEMVVV